MADLGVAEIALSVLCMLLFFLPGLSPRMYRISWFFSTLISWICYGLAFYVIGVSFSSRPSFGEGSGSGSADLACSALLFVGLANSIVGRSIPDPNHHLSASYQQLPQMVFVLVLILSPWSVGIGIGSHVPFWLLLSALFYQWLAQEMGRCFSASARSRTKEDLLISEYMAKMHTTHGRGHPSECHYIVSRQVASTMWPLPTDFGMGQVTRRAGKKVWQKIKNLLFGAPFYDLRYESTSGATRYDKLVTVQDIWKHIPASMGGKLLNGRDVCLSFALFKLLRRRFRGYNLHESGLGKTREFALQGLLSDPPSSTPESPDILLLIPSSFSSSTPSSPRAFRIIEAELGFLFDFFYGSHFPFLSTIIFIGWTSYLSFSYHFKFRDEHKTHRLHGIASASTIFFMFPLLGIWQLLLALSNWYKVALLVRICQRRKRVSSSQESLFHRAPAILLELLRPDMILGRLSLHFTCRSSWSNQVWQYCLLLHDDSSHFGTRKIPTIAKEALVNALVDTLRHRDGVLSDGESSLSRNGQDHQRLWACFHDSVAENIIVWHVATTLCHVGYVQTREESQGRKIDEDHEVATVLSGYCAYLVGFAPELIADDIYATRLVFNNACAAAMERVNGEGSVARMHESAKTMTFGSSGIDFAAATKLDVVSQGKMLAAQLLKLEDNILWKVLADFWAELMLFISAADNAAAHLEKLKTGGELITHIWALLTHTGILERPPTQKEYEANQTSEIPYAHRSDVQEELV